jgi:hypothetical protein
MQAPASPDTRRANRKNALKSTGPRTDIGKRVAAGNAKRHGLSVPPGPGLERQMLVLTEIVESEGIDHSHARDLDLKIMEDERNLAYELDQLRPQPTDPTAKTSEDAPLAEEG